MDRFASTSSSVFIALAVLCCCAVSSVVLAAPGSNANSGQPLPETEALLSRLSLNEQIRELSQYDINSLLYPTRDSAEASPGFGYGWIREDLVEQMLDDNKIGSLFNSPSAGDWPVPPVEWFRKLQSTLWNLSRAHGSRVPILYGIDSIHGASYIWNATLFPQQIGVAATFNTTHAQLLGHVCAKETRYAGIPWVFSPVLGIAVQPSWARVFETFGEDPFLASEMGINVINGYQMRPPPEMFPQGTKANYTVAACAKHFVGYPDARTGRDRTPVELPYNSLMQYFVPPFDRAINDPRAQVLSIMENYIELNGQPVVASSLLLNFLLRSEGQLNFQNLLVTDYNEIFNLYDFHKYSGSYEDAIYDSLNATSIDMAMQSSPFDVRPNVTDVLQKFYAQEKIDPTRIRASAGRVIDMKVRLGLIGDDATSPVPPEQTEWSGPNCFFGCDEHRQMAYEAARDSITLLQNNGNVLPVDFSAVGSIAVIGQACNSTGLMSGGWTVHWQGTSNESAIPTGSTILQQIQTRFPHATTSFSKGCNVTEDSICGDDYVNESLTMVQSADVVVLCIGERHYAEKPGDIFDMNLPGQQKLLVAAISAQVPTTTKIIAVLIEGRPRILGDIPQQVHAVVHAYLPGPFGGRAVVDVLSGLVNPSGKLPITYPKTVNAAPIQYWRKPSSDTSGDYTGAVQWTFGHGLSYTTFAYSDLAVMMLGNDVSVQVSVNNTGTRAGAETVLVYSTQTFRRTTPEVQMLRAFTKVLLQPGQSQTVSLTFPLLALAFYDETNCQQMQSAPFTVSIGNSGVNYTTSFGIVRTFPTDVTKCGSWGQYFMDHQSGPVIYPTPPPAPIASTQDYFISSIVCFGAGIVITVIVVSFIRRRKERSDNSLLEPAGI